MRRPEPKFVKSADGTSIAYYVLGHGPITWVAPPAMGAPLVAMLRLYDAVSDALRVVTWDMRGFHRSGAPADPEALTIPSHADDLEAVVRAEGLERFVLGGWSMGVPTSLEYLRRAPGAPLALVLINGPFEAALSHAVPIPGLAHAVTHAIDRVGERLGRVANPWSVRLLGRDGTAHLLEKVGVIAREPDYFQEILADFSRIDWARYFRVIRHLHDYDGKPSLPLATMPTLVVAGSRDPMTPVRTGERLKEHIPHAELFVVEGGTHYTPCEFHGEVAARVRAFVAEHLRPPA